jgi:hypothetical protein
MTTFSTIKGGLQAQSACQLVMLSPLRGDPYGDCRTTGSLTTGGGFY